MKQKTYNKIIKNYIMITYHINKIKVLFMNNKLKYLIQDYKVNNNKIICKYMIIKKFVY